MTKNKNNKPIMKYLYKLILVVDFLFLSVAAMGQAGQGFPRPAFQWKSPSADSLLNFHPATVTPLQFDSVPYAEDYTVVVVYKPVADTEATVWRLVFADSIVRGLTTERIISDSTTIRYAGQTERKAVIHTLRQSAPDRPGANVSLSVGDGNIKVSEVLYFDRRLSNAALRRVQSVLAIRYGITLGPVDYIGGSGDRVWTYRRDSAMYHHRITGIGNDTACGLHQLRSRSEVDGAVVTLGADSLPQGTYLLIGDNDAPLVFEQNGSIETLRRNWKIQYTKRGGERFSLAFDTRGTGMPGDSLVLLVGNHIYLPDNVGGDGVVFSRVEFPDDSCLFTLGRGGDFWQLAQSKGRNGSPCGGAEAETGGADVRSRFSTRMYPNPTGGHYTLEVEGAEQVRVTIYNAHGTVVASHTSEGGGGHTFEGALPSGNVYYATVRTENGSQTMKLVVK